MQLNNEVLKSSEETLFTTKRQRQTASQLLAILLSDEGLPTVVQKSMICFVRRLLFVVLLSDENIYLLIDYPLKTTPHHSLCIHTHVMVS